MRIPPISLRPDRLDPGDRIGFRYAGPDVGYRHRIGGEPSIGPNQWPDCPACSSAMTFYGQLDSINDEVVLADVGVVLVFICFDCFEATAQVESG